MLNYKNLETRKVNQNRIMCNNPISVSEFKN